MHIQLIIFFRKHIGLAPAVPITASVFDFRASKKGKGITLI